jgi:hypothetical protein
MRGGRYRDTVGIESASHIAEIDAAVAARRSS